MKKVNWVIDKYLFDEYENNLVSNIKLSSANVHFYDDLCGISFREFMTNKFTDNDIVVFHGSLQHGKQLSHLPIYPGTFMSIDNYECYNYYGYFGDNLLNSDYIMMGFNDLLRNKEKIFNYFNTIKKSKQDGIFIRPSNGYKTFAGQLLSYDNFEREYNVLLQSYGGVEPNTLVLVSNKQNIIEEYRFTIIDGVIINGSTYFDSENIGTFNPHYNKLCKNEEVIEFTNKMVQLYQPDKAYTIDVCKTNKGEYKLLELNSFNCASMYGNSTIELVNAVNELTIKEYNELFEI